MAQKDVLFLTSNIMKTTKTITTIALFLLITSISFGQKKWFKTYQDSIALVKDANTITKKFTKDLKKMIEKYKHKKHR